LSLSSIDGVRTINLETAKSILSKQMFAVLHLLAVVGLSASDDNDGPMEKAGEKADEAVSDTKRALEDAAD
jgi:hypothetical protein